MTLFQQNHQLFFEIAIIDNNMTPYNSQTINLRKKSIRVQCATIQINSYNSQIVVYHPHPPMTNQ